VADYTGPNGFFQNINPPTLELAIGNAGGNSLNTQYTVNSNGTVTTFIVPAPGTNTGTANVTFEAAPVPEPGVLSLAGIALLGAAGVSLRKRRNKS
jgi:LPXTG-motif cell wall-anchored protein